MTENWKVDIFLNPLLFPEADTNIAGASGSSNFSEAVLRYSCKPDVGCDWESIISRYKEIFGKSARLCVVPNEERILTKLIWPLKNAICCYMLGNYLGTIAICGMVAEMASILKFEISHVFIDNRELDSTLQRKLFGKEFEKLGQQKRVEVLTAFQLIDSGIKESFNRIRKMRNRYLHFLSQGYENIKEDALTVFSSAISIVVDLIGQEVSDGKFVLKPDMVTYLEKKGIASKEAGS